MSYREIPFGFGACVKCDKVVAWGLDPGGFHWVLANPRALPTAIMLR